MRAGGHGELKISTRAAAVRRAPARGYDEAERLAGERHGGKPNSDWLGPTTPGDGIAMDRRTGDHHSTLGTMRCRPPMDPAASAIGARVRRPQRISFVGGGRISKLRRRTPKNPVGYLAPPTRPLGR